MIGRLTGRVLEAKPDHVVLDVGGVGYHLHVPLGTFYRLTEGETATLHVHTHVREDAIQLYGFAGASEKETFELLIGISGIGPRVALALLSGIGVEELFQSVQARDASRLQKIPGVGKKTAERVLLELKDRRLRATPGGAAAADGVQGGDPSATGPVAGQEVREDAISALVNLGYTRDVAAKVVDRVRLEKDGDQTTLEGLLRAALGKMGVTSTR